MANWAWIIGINHYQRLQNLKYAVQDAQLMKHYCENEQFRHVFYFSDCSPEFIAPDGFSQETRPTFTNLWSFLVDFFECSSLKAGDNFWFFFSGHGIRHKEKDYLMPCDANPRDVTRTAIEVNEITEGLRRCGAGNVILFLDACRSQGSRSGLGIGEEEHQGVITISSCAPSEESYEIEEIKQGSFTYALLEALRIKGENNCATVERLNRRLQRRVREINRQYNKPSQTPYTKVEPIAKTHLILLPQQANEHDLSRLVSEVINAEKKNNLELVNQLLAHILKVHPPTYERALQALRRIRSNLDEPSSSSEDVSDSKGEKDRGSTTLPDDEEKPQDRFIMLRELLKAHKWKEADGETARVMLEIAEREQEGFLLAKNICEFPCSDLRRINQLWLESSNNRFGLSVQKRIWLQCGGKAGQFNFTIFEKFSDRVGWRSGNNFLENREDYNFTMSAPRGHLPSWRFSDLGSLKDNFRDILSRWENCYHRN